MMPILSVEVDRDRFVLSTLHVNQILLLIKLTPGDSFAHQYQLKDSFLTFDEFDHIP